MAESTLSLQLSDLQGEVGLFLGFGRGTLFGDPAWTTQQQAILDSCTKSGLRQFYYPPPMAGTASSYDWSFLKPTASLDLPNNGSVIPLPDDFGSPEGQITVLTTTAQVTWPLDIVGEGRIRQLFTLTPQATGRPLEAAIQPLRGTGPTAGQRFQLFVFPLADQDYTLQAAYYVNPDYLTGATPYAYGGMAHAETILESCLAIAEQRLDDASSVHTAKFQERLAASISLDRRLKPEKLGYNADRSDRAHGWRRADQHGWSLVQVGGVQY